MKKKLGGEIVVYPVNDTTVDIFTGKGWTNWSRFTKEGKALKLTKGLYLDSGDYTKVRSLV